MLDAAVELMGCAGRGGSVRVRGDSMRPTLLPGEVLAVEFSVDRIRGGDLLIFRQADYLVVHRFLGDGRGADGRPCLRTRGDGVLALDPPLEASRVVGRVIAVHRGGAWRSVQRRAARAYARALALHDLMWAAAGVASGRIDAMLGARGSRLAVRPWVQRMDRWLLRLLDGLLFERIHPPAPRPEEGMLPEPASPAPRER